MDIIKSRYGLDRSIEKLGDRRIRVMGQISKSPMIQKNDKGKVTMFDFDGGHYNLGGTIKHQKTTWKIKDIIVEDLKIRRIGFYYLKS